MQTIPNTEFAALDGVQHYLNQAIPASERIELDQYPVGYYAEENCVLALSLQFCELDTIPEALPYLAHLQRLKSDREQARGYP